MQLGGVSLWFRHGVLVETRGVCRDVACLRETQGSDTSEKMMSTESAWELAAERHWQHIYIFAVIQIRRMTEMPRN